MNPAKLQRGTHALFSRLRIRAPIDPEHQDELRTKMRNIVDMLKAGTAESMHIGSLIEWVMVTRAMIKPPVYQEALIPTVAAGVAVQNILDRFAAMEAKEKGSGKWGVSGQDSRALEDWLPYFDEMVAAANKWEVNAAALEADKQIRRVKTAANKSIVRTA